MTAYLKSCPVRVGIVTNVYYSDTGQKRLVVEFPYGVLVDAAVTEFELK